MSSAAWELAEVGVVFCWGVGGAATGRAVDGSKGRELLYEEIGTARAGLKSSAVCWGTGWTGGAVMSRAVDGSKACERS